MNDKNEFTETSPSVADSDLDGVEAAIGYSLPHALRRFLLEHNGGRAALNCFKSKTGSEFEINRFLGVKFRASPKEPTLEEVVDAMTVQKAGLPRNLIPFAEDAGGNYYCIDRLKERVVFCDHEHLADVPFVPTDVAESFETFISQLMSQDEMYKQA